MPHPSNLRYFASFPLATAVCLALFACGSSTSSTSTESVASPAFSLAGGTYASAQTVALTCATSGASIYYTIDSSTPTTASTLYTGVITVNSSSMIRAIAARDGVTSSVTSATYTITSGSIAGAVIPWNTTIAYGALTDSRDGKSYRTVKIGAQTWMAENLNYAGSSGTTGVCYNNSADSCKKYGRLYTWAEVTRGNSSKRIPSGVQGVCPTGWHVPSDTEWTTMTDYIGGTSAAGTMLKSTGGWSTDTGADANGFRALPAGSRSSGGSFGFAGEVGYWWSATATGSIFAWSRSISKNGTNVYPGYFGKENGFSLRCLQD